MHFREGAHEGRPHFHAVYGGRRASFDVTDLARLEGDLPRRVERLVREWAGIHQAELLENWERARDGRQTRQIKPLK